MHVKNADSLALLWLASHVGYNICKYNGQPINK